VSYIYYLYTIIYYKEMSNVDILEAIYTRRSIRRFTGEIISDENIKTVLKAGFCAPSAHNKKPWHFVVLKDAALLESISDFHPYAKMLPKAGCGIVVCGDKDKEGMTGFLVEDCSAAIQNMLLAAHGIGLGSVWCGLYPVPQLTSEMRKILNLPENIVPIGMVVLGHGDEHREPSSRYDDAKIHFDKW
jgi:nitroreductase